MALATMLLFPYDLAAHSAVGVGPRSGLGDHLIALLTGLTGFAALIALKHSHLLISCLHPKGEGSRGEGATRSASLPTELAFQVLHSPLLPIIGGGRENDSRPRKSGVRGLSGIYGIFVGLPNAVQDLPPTPSFLKHRTVGRVGMGLSTFHPA